MPRELDSRNFDYTPDFPTLADAVQVVTATLPGAHSIRYERQNPMTGSPVAIISDEAPSVSGSLIEEALLHVESVCQALVNSRDTHIEFLPDGHIQKTRAGTQIVHLHQYYQGIPVFEMSRTVQFSPNRSVVKVTGDTVAIRNDIDLRPQMGVLEAASIAIHYMSTPDKSEQPEDKETEGKLNDYQSTTSIDISEHIPNIEARFRMPCQPTVVSKGPFEESIPAYLVLFYQGPEIRLGWHFLITFPDYRNQYVVIVACDSEEPGSILYCRSTLIAVVSGEVFVENPGGGRTRTKLDFPLPISEYPLDIAVPFPGFPLPWVADDKTEGNNAIALLNATGKTLKGKSNETDIIFAPLEEDQFGSDQRVLNIFYFCNYMHDFFYLLGFDEESGNFQQNNMGMGGLGSDRIQARVYEGQLDALANILIHPDGTPSVLHAGISQVRRHTALDAEVIFHEYTHGVSHRLVGGTMEANSLALAQSRGLSEGWSDFFALTVVNFHRNTEKDVIGNWVSGDPDGLRKFRYTSNFPANFSTLGMDVYVSTQPHEVGSIWCATLLEMNRNLRMALKSRNLGYRLSWQLVFDSLKRLGLNPSFLDARDAIFDELRAMLDSGLIKHSMYRTVRKAAWKAFAKFGMGLGARCNGAHIQNNQDFVADFNESVFLGNEL